MAEDAQVKKIRKALVDSVCAIRDDVVVNEDAESNLQRVEAISILVKSFIILDSGNP